jgi:hypothetical protein
VGEIPVELLLPRIVFSGGLLANWKRASRKLAGLVTTSLSAVSEAPTSEELGVETLCGGASDTAT